MNWLKRFIAWTFADKNDDLPHPAIAVEELVDTAACAVAYNLNDLTGRDKKVPISFRIADVLGAAAIIATFPVSLPLMGFLDSTVKGIARKYRRQLRALPPYEKAARMLLESSWAARLPNGELVREKDHILIGKLRGTNIPALAHIRHLAENMQVAGPTGSGKDYRVINPVINQALARGWRVMKINHKRDDADAKVCAAMAKVNGVPYKCFTLDSRKPGNMMNFQEMSHRDLVEDITWLQILIAAMGLNIPTANNGTFHSDKVFQSFAPVILNYRPKTFQEMLDILHDPTYARKFKLQDYDFRYANHLFAKLMQPASNVTLNLTKETAPPEIYENRFDFGPELCEPGMSYFDLVADTDSVLAPFVSDMIYAHVMAAANVWPKEKRVPVLLVISDAARAMSPTLDHTLRHCRGFGISMCLGHQSMADLGDYASSVSQNCRLRVIFGGADPDLVKQMRVVSGTVTKKLGTYADEDELEGLREVEVPRIGEQEILEMSMNPGVAIIDARPRVGLARWKYPVVIDVEFPIAREVFDAIAAWPWPAAPGAFIARDFRAPEKKLEQPKKMPDELKDYFSNI